MSIESGKCDETYIIYICPIQPNQEKDFRGDGLISIRKSKIMLRF